MDRIEWRRHAKAVAAVAHKNAVPTLAANNYSVVSHVLLIFYVFKIYICSFFWLRNVSETDTYVHFCVVVNLIVSW